MTEKARSSRSSSRGPGSPGSPPSHLLVGRIGRAVGLSGEVEVLVLSDETKRFAEGSVVLRADALDPLTVTKVRRTRRRAVVSFAEIGDRTGAEALRGVDLVIPVEQARPLAEGEFWDHDLMGCRVLTVEGDEVGTVTDVLRQPSSELLLVEQDGKSYLIPLVGDIVKDVEPGRRITIDPPEGLLD